MPQYYKVKLAEGQNSYKLTIIVNQGTSNCTTCVVNVGVVESGETPQVIQTGDSVTIAGPNSNSLGYQKEKTLDVQLGVGEYVLMVDGKPTPSKITVTK